VCVRLVIGVELLEGQKGSGMPKMADTGRFLRKCTSFGHALFCVCM
jgi:hypothetical protein